MLQAGEGGRVEAVFEQLRGEVVQYLFGLREVFSLKVGIQAEETYAAEHFAFAPGAVGQAVLEAQFGGTAPSPR